MNYTLRQLEVFTKICEYKSITKAAEALHMTQPAASIQLKNFQDQFDISLTEVIGRQLYVTAFGEEIYAACINILNLNKVDFSLVSILPEAIAIDNIQLMSNQLYLIGSKQLKHPKKSQDPSFIADLPLIYRESGSGTRQTMERFLERHNIKPRKMLELTSNEAVKQAVIAGLGYSIVPLIGLKNELVQGELSIIPIKGMPIESSWNLIWLKSKKFSPPARAFLDYITSHKDDIMHRHFEWFEHKPKI